MLVVDPPAGLPVTPSVYAEMAHIDLVEGPQIEALLAAATDVVETGARRPILRRTVDIALPERDWSEFWLPCAPAHELVDAPDLQLRRGFDEPRLWRSGPAPEAVRVVVGYETAQAAPQQLIRAIVLLVSEWRAADITAGEAFSAPVISFGVQRLIKQVRYQRPQECR